MILVYDANSLCCSIVFDFNVTFLREVLLCIDCTKRISSEKGKCCAKLFSEIIELEMTFVNTDFENRDKWLFSFCSPRWRMLCIRVVWVVLHCGLLIKPLLLWDVLYSLPVYYFYSKSMSWWIICYFDVVM